MIRLTKEDIIAIHDQMIDLFGGEYGIRDDGTLEMLCEAPFQSGFGMEFFPDIFDKAAKFLEGFARHQVFFDGNKRTGLDTMNTYLKLNGIQMTISNEEAYNFVIGVANDLRPIEEISGYIKEHSIPYVKESEREYSAS